MNEASYGAGSKEYFPGIGGASRPFSGVEVAWFSSRGPTADGRLDPDVVASAVGNIGQGFCPDQLVDACSKRLSLVSGTSFAAPIVSGIAAVLAEAVPAATATQKDPFERTTCMQQYSLARTVESDARRRPSWSHAP